MGHHRSIPQDSRIGTGDIWDESGVCGQGGGIEVRMVMMDG